MNKISKKEIALKYLSYLETGDLEKIITLFQDNGTVDSPIYGIKSAQNFYVDLLNDTNESVLTLKGVFEEIGSDSLALYFTYKWTLQNKDIVIFDVVDILEFDANNKITKLKIIYDTVQARPSVEQIKKGRNS